MRANEFITELSYPGNIGIMELTKFHSMATPEQKNEFRQLMNAKDSAGVWKLVQSVVGVKLHGKEFNEDEDYYEDEDGDEELVSVNVAKAAIPELVKVAQTVYDDWDEANTDTYANGGICHLVADEFASVLSNLKIPATTVSSNFEQHVYTVAKFVEGVFSIDIHYNTYETGGGFRWKKIPNVVMEPSDVVFYRISSDPAEFEDIIGYE